MAQVRLHNACNDCDRVVQHAATLLSSSREVYLDLDIPYDKQYQSQLLANVASSKCHICALLHAHIPWLREPLESGEDSWFGFERHSGDPSAVVMSLCKDGGGYTIILPGRLRFHEVGHGNVRTVNSFQSWSLETLDCVQSWLQNCTSFHDLCSKHQEPHSLPRRLIDVDSAGTFQLQPSNKINQNDFDRLRLINSNGVRIVPTQTLSPDTEYLTLSHRWGNPPGLVLPKETPFHLIDDVSPVLLNCAEATVFQYAIHVTRCLGFRYIWIDALCIMQDDEAEKNSEIVRMDDIYFRSMLNTSASEADLIRGLVFDRNLLATNPCRTTTKVPAIDDEMSLHVFGDDCSLRMWEKPLGTRGWVFQERTLSPRIVHFTKDQVFWECWSLNASEILPEGFPEPNIEYNDKRIGLDPTISDVQQIKSRWYRGIVDNYSCTSLSFPEDHLLALSAVAKRFCSAMRMDQSEYLAGMWKDDLPLSLLWVDASSVLNKSDRISGPAETTGPDLEMRYAPSWSWASVMVRTMSIGFSSLVATTEVIEIEVDRRSQNFFDGTNSCRIRLKGAICKFRRDFGDGTPWIEISEGDTFRETDEVADSFGGSRTITMFWDSARSFKMDEGYLLYVATGRDPEQMKKRGLVLLRITKRGTYKRVGTFFVRKESNYHGSKLESAFEGKFKTLGKEDYLDLDCNGKYTIDII